MGRRKRHAGFTLIELLIVLAVLVGLAALAAPAMRNALAKRELQSAGKELRNAMAEARLAAVESGRCQRFRYRRGTGAYEIAPLRSERGLSARGSGRSLGERLSSSTAGADEDGQGDPVGGFNSIGKSGASAASEMTGGSRSTAGGGKPGGSTASKLRRMRGNVEAASSRRLPAEVWFADPEQPDAPPPAGAERRAETPSSDSTAADARDWSEPVLFFPNGRSTPTVLYLRGQNDLVLRIELRALAGSIKLGELTTVDASAAKPGVPRPTKTADRPERPTARPPRDATASPRTAPDTAASPPSRVEPKAPLGPQSNPPAQSNVNAPRGGKTNRQTQPATTPPRVTVPPADTPANPIPTEAPP